MKKLNVLALIFISVTLFYACNDSDDPMIVNEEEVITTLTATLTPEGGGTMITLQSRDLDGDGPNEPVITISGDLTANTVYDGAIEVLNETISPADNITLEVLEEGDEHQFFFTASNNFVTVAYADFDTNNDPIGIDFTLTTGNASSGNLTITLRHEPNKAANGVNSGDITNAGGETDVEVTFSVTVM